VDVHVTQNKALRHLQRGGDRHGPVASPKSSWMPCSTSSRASREEIRVQQRNKALTALAEDGALITRVPAKRKRGPAGDLQSGEQRRRAEQRPEPGGGSFFKQVTQEKQRLMLQLSDISLAVEDVDSSLQQRQRITAAANPRILRPGPPKRHRGDGRQRVWPGCHGRVAPARNRITSTRSVRSTFLRADRNELLKTRRAAHPDVIAVDEKIEKMETILDTYRTSLGELKGQQADIQRRLTVLDANTRSSPNSPPTWAAAGIRAHGEGF